eukprot:9031084-Ditylum_brightwellii.AAC.1
MEFKCTVFEDNTGCIELAKCPRTRPRTKHISIKYYHFRKKVKEGLIKVLKIDTKDQQADILTNDLGKGQLLALQMSICGW